MDLVNKQLGAYRLVSLIGKGGMAEVWLGSQVALNRQVAVKVLQESGGRNEELRLSERFAREAHSIASLDHPGILSVIDYGQADGYLYLVMPYIPGGSLQDQLKHEPLTRAQAFNIFERILSGLNYAHRRGIIHRDLKPANILLHPDGRAVIADFGVAKTLSEDVSLTQTGSAVGSPQYMSPEQFMGYADFRSDLYSMGVILYQLLTGRLLFSGTTSWEIANRHINDPLPLPDPMVPPAFEEFLSKALHKRPEQRFANADQMEAAFHQAVSTLSPQELQFRPPRYGPPSRLTSAHTDSVPPVTMLPTTPISLPHAPAPPPTQSFQAGPPQPFYNAPQANAYGPTLQPGSGGMVRPLTPIPSANSPYNAMPQNETYGAAPQVQLPTPPPASWTPAPTPAVASKKGGLKPGLIIGLVVLLVLVAGGIGLFLATSSGSTKTPAPAPVPTALAAVPTVVIDPNAQSITVQIRPQNGTKVSGTGVITATPDGQVLVVLNVSGLEPREHHAHIHMGTCLAQGAIVYPLNDLQAGGDGKAISTTKVNASFATITAGNLYLNVHNETGTPTYVAGCGEIAA